MERGPEMDAAVAEAIGVDRRPPPGVAEAEVGKRYAQDYGYLMTVRSPTGAGHYTVELPAGHLLPPVADEENYPAPYNRRYPAFAGRWLAERFPEVAAEIAAYLLPARPYSTDWNAAMTLRAWVLRGGPMRETRFAYVCVALLQAGVASPQGIHPDALRACLAQVPLGQPDRRALRAWMVFTPADLCQAVLLTAEEEREMAKEPSGEPE